MAFIKKGTCNSAILIERRSKVFDYPYNPEQEVLYSGIYRCVCGLEILHPAKKKLPPYDPPHHIHDFDIIWKLVVSIDEVPNTIEYLHPKG